jgi:hypothetical protein
MAAPSSYVRVPTWYKKNANDYRLKSRILCKNVRLWTSGTSPQEKGLAITPTTVCPTVALGIVHY